MSRLTKKEPNNLSCHHFRRCEYLRNGTPRIETLNKLGKLEDLEEELGCPLEVVFKKIKELMEENKNNINYNCCLEYDSVRKLWYIQDYRYYCGSYDVDNPELYLKDYQKTWWLKGERDAN